MDRVTEMSSGYVSDRKSTEMSSGYSSAGKSTEMSSGYGSAGKSTEMSSGHGSAGKSTEMSSGYGSAGKSTEMSSGYGSAGKSTEMSSEHSAGAEGSVLGGSMQQEMKWNAEYLLGIDDKVAGYTIVGAIAESGEAQVFVGEKDGKKYVVKIYKKAESLDDNVVEKLKGQEYPYLAYMVDAGKTQIETLHGTTEKAYEISPLYISLEPPVYRYDNPDKRTSYRELKKLIEQVNEGLHILKDLEIAHRDIKPANIMMDEKGNYRIIDFGISRVVAKGQTTLDDEVGITHDYAAPEAERDDKSGMRQDYYSLGISLYELYMGELPYAEYGERKRESLRASQGVDANIPLERGMPRELIKLIHGLTYYNSDPARNKDRWGYQQVKDWLKNPDAMEDLVMMPGAEASSDKKAAGNREASKTYEEPFGFNKKEIFDSYTLADELGSHWAEGMKQVGRGYVRDFFKENKSRYSEYASACEDARISLENARTELERNKAFWELLYYIEPKLKKFYWHIAKADGTTGYTCEEIGAHLFLKAMENRKTGETIPGSIRELADSGLLPIYLGKQLQDEERGKKAEELLEDLKSGDAEIAAWRLGYLLTGKALFVYRGETFETREQLYQYIVTWTDSLSTDEAVAVARNFAYTKEFQAWIQSKEDDKKAHGTAI